MRRGEDEARVTGMGLYQLAQPLCLEQVDETLRRVLGLYELRVVSDGAEENAQRRKGAIGVDMPRCIMPRCILRNVGRQPTCALPGQSMRTVRRVDEIHVVDARGVFLGNAREDALGT